MAAFAGEPLDELDADEPDEEEPDEAGVPEEPEPLDAEEALSGEEPFEEADASPLDEPEELVIAELSEVLALSVR
ncbi:hypothetical protein [Nocardiopsis chromatogenes]|uniref:hypothetical protein n=1 Tax=Nocardiopsis chromatogenes TaxID=280239 RepID=UPI0003481852